MIFIIPSIVLADAGSGVSVQLTTVVISGQSGGNSGWSGWGGSSGGASYVPLEDMVTQPNPPSSNPQDMSWNKEWTSTSPPTNPPSITPPTTQEFVPVVGQPLPQESNFNWGVVAVIAGIILALFGVVLYFNHRNTARRNKDMPFEPPASPPI